MGIIKALWHICGPTGSIQLAAGAGTRRKRAGIISQKVTNLSLGDRLKLKLGGEHLGSKLVPGVGAGSWCAADGGRYRCDVFGWPIMFKPPLL